MPVSGPVIFASNHQSLLDPPLVGGSCPREIVFAAKKELFDIPVLRAVIKHFNALPVRRSGFDKNAIVLLGKALNDGRTVLIFPEGTRHRDGRIRSPRFGVGMLALKHNVPVVPVCIDGSRSLGSQIYRRKLVVSFGAPIYHDDLNLKDSDLKAKYRTITFKVMRRIAEVGGLEPPVLETIRPGDEKVSQMKP